MARAEGRWRRFPASSPPGCTTNASASTPPAASVREIGLTKQTRQELFLSAHDVKGDSGTFGYPAVAPAADSLCRLLEHTPDLTRIPLAIVDQHVDAVRAIVREHARADISVIAHALTTKLRQVTDEFLAAEKQASAGLSQGDFQPVAGAARAILQAPIPLFEITRYAAICRSSANSVIAS